MNNASTSKNQGYAPLSSNILHAINSINQMNNMQNVFSNSNTTTSSLTSIPQNTTTTSNVPSSGNLNSNSQNKVGGTSNYTTYESGQTTSTTTYGGMYSTGSKSPTNATTNKEPNKYAQYIPREIPLRSNNLNPTSKMDNASNPYANDKKKEINITTTTPDMNFMMKNKFTPTNNTTSGIGGIGGGGKIYVPTGDLKKPTDPYSMNVKPTLSKPGMTYTTTTSSKPLGRK